MAIAADQEYDLSVAVPAEVRVSAPPPAACGPARACPRPGGVRPALPALTRRVWRIAVLSRGTGSHWYRIIHENPGGEPDVIDWLSLALVTRILADA
ncbi:hypothetical protein KRM28CT15_26300 [Krasilnikovia sp. M28-CT-15]